MFDFEQMTQFANGCKIDHLPDRSVTVLKHPKKDGVIVEMRRADPDPKFQGMSPSIFKIETKEGKQIEVTGVAISIEAAMALLLCLNDYFKRIEPAADIYREAGGDEKDLIIHGLEEGAENWKSEYDSCRRILSMLVELKELKELEGETDFYKETKPMLWKQAKEFLKKYQHL